MFGNLNGCNNFGIGFNPGMMAPGTNVKITQTTTGMGRGSIFNGCPGGYSNTTNITVNNGLDGFWGGAAGFLSGLSGNFCNGWNNMCSGFGNMFGGNMFGGNMFGGGGLIGSFPMPDFTQGIGTGTGAIRALNGTGTSALSGATAGDQYLTNLNTLNSSGKWKIVPEGNGQYRAYIPGDYTTDGEPITIQGDYNTVADKMTQTKLKATATTTTTTTTTTATGGTKTQQQSEEA